MGLKGTEKNSIHSLKGATVESTVDKHTPIKTEPRFGTGLREVSKSELGLKGQIPAKYKDDLPV